MMVGGVVKKIVILFTLLFSITKVRAESSTYTIKLAGFTTLNATHIKNNSIDYYSIISDVEVKFYF